MPRVLLIDDDPLFGRIFVHQAARCGCDADYRPSLIDAVYGGDLARYDAVIIDCVMPGTDGFELSTYFHTFLRGLPVILISARQGVPERLAEEGRDASVFVPKARGVGAILAAAFAAQSAPRSA